MRNTIANEIIKKAKEDKKLYLVAGDAGLGVWDDFKEEYSEQYLNPGVNEQFDIGFCAGLALKGYKPIFYNIAPFVIMRPYEQVRNDICYQNLPVILIGTGSGITYAPGGMSHYIIEDISLTRTIPNLNVFSPIDPIETKKCFEYAYNSNSPSYIRIAKSGEKNIHKHDDFDISKPIIVKEGEDVVLFIHGSIADEIVQIDDILSNHNINITIVSNPMLKTEHIKNIIDKHTYIFTLEEHYIEGGFGSILSEYCNQNSIFKKIYKIGIRYKFIHEIGDRNYLRNIFKIDATSVSKQILEVVNNG